MPCTAWSQLRMTSPPRGFSILMTSAPMSANRCVANGPAAACSNARTLMPLSADSAIFGLGERVIVGSKLLLPDHDAAAVVDHDRAILFDHARPKLHDPPLRSGFRLTLLEHRALRIDR